MKSPGWIGLAPMFALALSFFSFISSTSAFQKPIPQLAVTSPSSGLEGASFALTADKGGSTGAVTWSVSDLSGHAVIDGTTLQLQQAGTVKLKVDIAADDSYSAFTIYKLVTIQSSDTEKTNMAQIWGTTRVGGAGNAGTLFRMNADGTGYTKMSEFVSDPGGVSAFFNSPMVASNGIVYGTLSSGGENNVGVIYKYDPFEEVYSTVYQFKSETGSYPSSTLSQHSNGLLYGIASGGTNDARFGALFSLDPSNDEYTVVKYFDFNSGFSPISAPREGTDGKLYGTTLQGGDYGGGVLYEFDPSNNNYTVRHSFGTDDGSALYAAPRLASNGKLYGTTYNGGTSSSGTIWEFDLSNNTLTTKYSMNSTDGMSDYNGFSEETDDGLMYLSLPLGGTNFAGVLISYQPGATSVNVVKNFDCSFGCQPYGAPHLGNDGNIYGVFPAGGSKKRGIIYKYNPASEELTSSYDFDKGYFTSGIAETADGVFYVVASSGGESEGYLASYDRSEDQFKIIKEHHYSIEGVNPGGNLASAGTSILLSMKGGGATGSGTMLDFNTTTNAITKRADYGAVLGSIPTGWRKHSSGKYYGTMFSGGSGFGVINQYDPQTKQVTTAYEFPGYVDDNLYYGAADQDYPLEADNGKIYGVARGGVNFLDAIYSFDPATKQVDFIYDFGTFQAEGSTHTILHVGADNTLWGIAKSGGANLNGVIFKYNLTSNEFTIVYALEEETGHPAATLLLADNGKLYGITLGNDFNVKGMIYEVDPTDDSFTVKYEFDANSGIVSNTNGQFLKANGKLFGATSRGGDEDLGHIFMYDPVSNSITLLQELTNMGGYNIYDAMILVKRQNEVTFNISDKTLGDDPFEVEADGKGDGNINYTTLSDHITIDGSEVTIVKAGRVSIKASQEESDNYDAADKEASFCINPVKPVITVAGNTLTSSASDGNQWYNNEAPVNNATSKTLQATQSGSYTVKSTVEGCVSASSESQPITISGLEDDIDQLVTVYPNPTSNDLFVKLPPSASSIEVSVIDHLGRPIESRISKSQSTEKFDVAQLPASVYIVKVVKDGKMISKVFIKR